MGEASAAKRAQTQANVCTYTSRICRINLNMHSKFLEDKAPLPTLASASHSRTMSHYPSPQAEELRNGTITGAHTAQLPNSSHSLHRALPSCCKCPIRIQRPEIGDSVPPPPPYPCYLSSGCFGGESNT